MSSYTLAQLRELQQSVKEIDKALSVAVDDLEKKLGQPVKEAKKTPDVAVDDPAEEPGPRNKQSEDLPKRPAKTPKESEDGKNPSETEGVVNRVVPIRKIEVRVPPKE
jgi:hypothetical protein